MTVHLYATKHDRSTELQMDYKQKPERYQNHKSCPLPTDSPYSYKNMFMGKRRFLNALCLNLCQLISQFITELLKLYFVL